VMASIARRSSTPATSRRYRSASLRNSRGHFITLLEKSPPRTPSAPGSSSNGGAQVRWRPSGRIDGDKRPRCGDSGRDDVYIFYIRTQEQRCLAPGAPRLPGVLAGSGKRRMLLVPATSVRRVQCWPTATPTSARMSRRWSSTVPGGIRTIDARWLQQFHG
jgi:hypothetical protein